MKLSFLFGSLLLFCNVDLSASLTDTEDDRDESNSNTTTCNGYKECAGSDIDSDYSYCGGYYGCYESDIRVTQISYNDGLRGAQESDISSENDIFCGGYVGCFMADIYAEKSAVCDGVSSCWHADIEAEDDIYLLGYRSGGAAEITGSCHDTDLHIYGSAATIYSVIEKVNTIYNYGLTGLYYADVDSEHVEELVIYSLGRSGSVYSQIYCRSGSSCKIFCRDYGCYGMEIRCYKGARCEYTLLNPSCDSSPTVLFSQDDDDDAEFTKLLETRKAAKSMAKQELKEYLKADTGSEEYSVDQLEEFYENSIKNAFESYNLVDGKLLNENEQENEDGIITESSINVINPDLIDVDSVDNVVYASEYSQFIKTHNFKHGQSESLDTNTLSTIAGAISAVLVLFAIHKFVNKSSMKDDIQHNRYQYQSI